jgi:hypothetical protein
VLLNDIIDLATDNQHPIAVLLRKCIVLSHQLRNERLKFWANNELNGYDLEDVLPSYRVFKIIAKGNFSGRGGSQIIGLHIPPAVLEEEHRRWAAEMPLIHPISVYEDLSKGGGCIEAPWDPNLVLYYQRRLPVPGYALISAWQEIPPSAIVGMLDTIRTRVLNMTLEIKAEVGRNDDDFERITPQAAKVVDQTIVNNIFGGNVYVSSGESTMNATTIQQQQQNIAAGDWEHLANVLRGAGISGAELDELSTAIKEDRPSMGTKVKKWITDAAPKVLSGGVKIGMTVGQTLLLEYLKQYYGLA